MPPYPLRNFEIQKYYQNESKFNGAYSRNNLPKIKDGANVINLDVYESIGTHWIALYVDDNNVTYFDSFRVEHVPKEIENFIGNKNIIKNIYRIQAYNSIKCGYFCIGFIDFMLKDKSLLVGCLYHYFKNMAEENISQEFRLNNTDETRNYLIEEINRKKLRSKKYKKICRTLNHIEHFLISSSTITGRISISAFGILIGITSHAIGLKVCAMTIAIKKYKSIIKKNKKKHDEKVLLAKSKLNIKYK